MQGSNNELSGGGRNNIVNAEIIPHGNNSRREPGSPGHVSVHPLPLTGLPCFVCARGTVAGLVLGRRLHRGGTWQSKCPLPTSGNYFFHPRRFTCASRNVSIVSKLTAPFSSIYPILFFLNLILKFFSRWESLSLPLVT